MASSEGDGANTPINEWILGPVGNAIQFVTSEHILASVIENSLVTMKGFPKYIELAATNPRLRDIGPALRKTIRDLHGRASENADLLKDSVGDHFERVYAHHLISVWGATETCIETTLQNCYMHIPDAHLIAKSAGFAKAKPANNTYEARKAVRGWLSIIDEHELKAAEIVFHAFGVNCSFDERDARRVQEISSIRNCILHNRGKITNYYLEMSPDLQERWAIGDDIILTREDSANAFFCCGRILTNILSAVVASPHMKYRSAP